MISISIIIISKIGYLYMCGFLTDGFTGVGFIANGFTIAGFSPLVMLDRFSN